MTDLRTAAQQALEALEDLTRYCSQPSNIWRYFYPSATGDYVNLREFVERAGPAITALRAALSQQERAKQIGEGALILRHVDVELFDSLRRAQQEQDEPVKRWPFVETPEQFSNRLFEAIREFSSILPAVRHVLIENPPLFTTPPRREWRGLTEDDIKAAALEAFGPARKDGFAASARAIEAKLKEKNT